MACTNWGPYGSLEIDGDYIGITGVASKRSIKVVLINYHMKSCCSYCLRVEGVGLMGLELKGLGARGLEGARFDQRSRTTTTPRKGIDTPRCRIRVYLQAGCNQNLINYCA